jgi:hypothetical protein
MKYIVLIVFAIASFYACNRPVEENNETKHEVPVTYNFSKEFKDYWLSSKAEISSYKLSKARYGEIHDGNAVFVFVVEPFLPNQQVKSDGIKTNEKSERVMKLIKTENFYTGIYPYSIMTSSFYPLNNNREGVLKISMSSQDWCGQVYSQINNREDKLEVQRFSYFQKEGDVKEKLSKGLLEEELFTQIRIDPAKLPIGNINLYPSSEYIRLMHKEFKKYNAEASLNIETNIKGNSKYTLEYSDLARKLVIYYESNFPHKIIEWEETYIGLKGNSLTTKAKLKENLQIAYWKHNSVGDSTYRKLLGI